MANLVHHTLNFAPQTTTTAATIIPPGYRPDLYVSDLFRERPLVSLASQGTIANATPFTVPKFSIGDDRLGDPRGGYEPLRRVAGVHDRRP